jgi:hypothetical protein
VHGVDAEGKIVVARKLRRKQVLAFFAKLAPCLVGTRGNPEAAESGTSGKSRHRRKFGSSPEARLCSATRPHYSVNCQLLEWSAWFHCHWEDNYVGLPGKS